jgi:pyridoxal biosynthesis lyase PdxS
MVIIIPGGESTAMSILDNDIFEEIPMLRTKGEAGTGNILHAVKYARAKRNKKGSKYG